MNRPVRIPGLRGRCGTCKRGYLVRADGRLPQHGPHAGDRCDGSGQRPVLVKGPGGTWKASAR